MSTVVPGAVSGAVIDESWGDLVASLLTAHDALLEEQGELNPYAPAWSSLGSPQPSKGNGFLVGDYVRAGRMVHFRIKLTAGSSTTFGNGLWKFTLPSSPDTSIAADTPMGRWTAVDASSGNRYAGDILGIDAANCYGTFQASGATTQSSLGTGGPFTPANSDAWSIAGTYVEL